MGEPLLVTVPNVPLVSVGDWPAGGNGMFSLDALLDAMAAFDDPGLATPRVWPGHDDERYRGDGEPAIGVIHNPTWNPDELTIYADLAAVPRWLADVLPAMYPLRSIEGWHDWISPVTGRKYKFAIDGLALLGVQPPAVSTLEDLARFVATGEGATLITAERATASVGHGSEPVGQTDAVTTTTKPVAASVSVDEVYRTFYAEHDRTNPWWWIREIMLAPNDLIVDDGEGALMKVPFDASDAGVTFGEPTKVRVEYVDEAAKTAASRRVVARFKSRDESRASLKNDEGDAGMADLSTLRSALGLADDAPDDEVIAAAAAIAANAPGEETPGDEGGEETPAPEVAPVVTPGTETEQVSAEVLKQLREDAAQGVAARKQQERERRTALAEQAAKDGKIFAHQVEGWVKKLAVEGEDAEKALASLAKDLVPVAAPKGSTQTSETAFADQLAKVRASFGIKKES